MHEEHASSRTTEQQVVAAAISMWRHNELVPFRCSRLKLSARKQKRVNTCSKRESLSFSLSLCFHTFSTSISSFHFHFHFQPFAWTCWVLCVWPKSKGSKSATQEKQLKAFVLSLVACSGIEEVGLRKVPLLYLLISACLFALSFNICSFVYLFLDSNHFNRLLFKSSLFFLFLFLPHIKTIMRETVQEMSANFRRSNSRQKPRSKAVKEAGKER